MKGNKSAEHRKEMGAEMADKGRLRVDRVAGRAAVGEAGMSTAWQPAARLQNSSRWTRNKVQAGASYPGLRRQGLLQESYRSVFGKRKSAELHSY